MPATSISKFASRSPASGPQKVYWGRADVDGLPYRGSSPPFFTNEEFDERTVKVGDPKNGTFDTGVKEENDQYLEVLDKIENGWCRLLYRDLWREEGKRHHLVYIEWCEYYLQDGTPTRMTNHHQPITEIAGHG